MKDKHEVFFALDKRENNSKNASDYCISMVWTVTEMWDAFLEKRTKKCVANFSVILVPVICYNIDWWTIWLNLPVSNFKYARIVNNGQLFRYKKGVTIYKISRQFRCIFWGQQESIFSVLTARAFWSFSNFWQSPNEQRAPQSVILVIFHFRKVASIFKFDRGQPTRKAALVRHG